jgi:hypothetical protein
MKKIDLHVHTTASDGELSPKEIVDAAMKTGLKAISITDHDTISGVGVAIEYAKGKDIEIVPGIEISCYEEELGFDEVHVIGLFIDYRNRALIEFTEKIRQDRIKQKKRIIKNLNKFGFDIKFEDIQVISNFSIGRPHIARALIERYPKEFSSVKDVFERYIAIGKPAYVEREFKVRINDAIKIIKKAKGICFLAHPGFFNEKDSLELIELFVEKGGQGIETIYPYDIVFPEKHKKMDTEKKILFFRKIAKNKGLIEAGGSDFHGKMRDPNLGTIKVSYDLLDKIKKAKSL